MDFPDFNSEKYNCELLLFSFMFSFEIQEKSLNKKIKMKKNIEILMFYSSAVMSMIAGSSFREMFICSS